MSKIEVDAITQQSGTTLTVGGGACKTATVDATTVNLGRSGGTVSLAAGATQSGFGRTGTVDWQTGSIKTSTFTAANGEGYFANTSGGAFVMNLPAGSAGAIVSVSDYTRTFQTNNLTVSPNGSEKIGGVAANATLSTEGQTATFVYVDATEGWINTQETSNSITGQTFITATGGTVTCSGDFKIHTFTGPGTFQVTQLANTPACNQIDYLVVAGGGGGGAVRGAGGGAGGYRESPGTATGSYTASPIAGGAALTATVTSFPITVGGGGTAGSGAGGNGNPSTFSTITSTGGGAGNYSGNGAGGAGGSGGGGSCGAGGSGNTPPVSPAQGNNGGLGAGPPKYGAGAGGGATAVGQGGNSSGDGGHGGAGATSSINATPTARAGGGGGSAYQVPAGFVGPGGAGGGGAAGGPGGSGGVAGTANTGGGGGGGYHPGPSSEETGGAGGSGIVIMRYRFQ
jgi:hypothetical protein